MSALVSTQRNTGILACYQGEIGKMHTYHRTMLGGEEFEMDSRYKPVVVLGHGACGVVISALDSVSGKKVAIKKIRQTFSGLLQTTRVLREIRLLRLLNHKNLVKLLDVLKPSMEADGFNEIYVVQELMETSLARVIKSKQPLTIDHIRCFVYQLLCGLKYLHSANVVHRDIKPGNLLVNANCELKICDFGLARAISLTDSPYLTEYVVTRWYRPPEVVLSCALYDSSVDIWSAGCVFAELLLRTPLFPGTDSVSQLRIICEKLGKPNEEDIQFIKSEPARRFMQGLKMNPAGAFNDLFPLYAKETILLNLLCQMLSFNPHKRINAVQALQHPFLSMYKATDGLSDFNFCDHSSPEDDRNFETTKQRVWSEIREFHPELPLDIPVVPTASNGDKGEVDQSTDIESDHSLIVGMDDRVDGPRYQEFKKKYAASCADDNNITLNGRVFDTESEDDCAHVRSKFKPTTEGAAESLTVRTETGVAVLTENSQASRAMSVETVSSEENVMKSNSMLLSPVKVFNSGDSLNPFSSRSIKGGVRCPVIRNKKGHSR